MLEDCKTNGTHHIQVEARAARPQTWWLKFKLAVIKFFRVWLTEFLEVGQGKWTGAARTQAAGG